MWGKEIRLTEPHLASIRLNVAMELAGCTQAGVIGRLEGAWYRDMLCLYFDREAHEMIWVSITMSHTKGIVPPATHHAAWWQVLTVHGLKTLY